jgi:hypothetical protein
MDSLYREMSETIEAQVMPIVTRPFAGIDWRSDLTDMVTRRIQVFETILPFRLSANIKRYQSAFLMADYARLTQLETQLVMAILPDHVRADRTGVAALCVALSFQSWRVLRHDQQLSPERAADVLKRMVSAIAKDLPA